jgi:hypothetical protein
MATASAISVADGRGRSRTALGRLLLRRLRRLGTHRPQGAPQLIEDAPGFSLNHPKGCVVSRPSGTFGSYSDARDPLREPGVHLVMYPVLLIETGGGDVDTLLLIEFGLQSLKPPDLLSPSRHCGTSRGCTANDHQVEDRIIQPVVTDVVQLIGSHQGSCCSQRGGQRDQARQPRPGRVTGGDSEQDDDGPVEVPVPARRDGCQRCRGGRSDQRESDELAGHCSSLRA